MTKWKKIKKIRPYYIICITTQNVITQYYEAYCIKITMQLFKV